MKKSILLFLLLFMLLASTVPALAVSEPLVYKEVITVTEDGGRYQIGFAEVEFKKEFIDSSLLPATFEIEIYAENGIAFIEFNTDASHFFKKVHIRAKKYNELLFDKAIGENILVDIKSQQILVEGFSRYSFH